MATEERSIDARGIQEMGATEAQTFHGGRLIARRLKAHGVSKLFTFSGGHLFSIYDGCRAEGIEIVDVSHESTAAFAAEGWAKVTREPGVCALTAGPGVTNGMSAIASAQATTRRCWCSAGARRRCAGGMGSLQEIDHVPFVRPLTKLAATPDSTAEIPGLVDEALALAMTPHGGPTFLDFPMDYVFMEAGRARARLRRGWRPAPPAGGGGRGRRADRTRGRAAEGRRAPGDHGRHRPLLGPRRGCAEGAGGDAADPGVPERLRAGLRAGRPRVVLLPRARRRR